MSRRGSGVFSTIAFVGSLILLLWLLVQAQRFMESDAFMPTLGFSAIMFLSWIVIRVLSDQADKRRLKKKWGKTEAFSRIAQRTIWQGETAEQLVDSLGTPEATEQSVTAAGCRETWKYMRSNRGNYRLRIALLNGVVVGWEKK